MQISDDDIAETLRQAGVSGAAATMPTRDHTNDDHAETLRQAGVPLEAIHKPQVREPVPEPPEERLSDPDRAKVDAIKRSLPVTSSIAEGMPIVGALPRVGSAAIAAAIPGMGEQGDTFSERFGKNERIQRHAQREYDAEHPSWAVPANFLGGMLAAGPFASTKIGRHVLGMEGASLGSRAYQGAAGGTGIGYLDALSRGENPFVGGLVGGVAGFASPFIGEGGRVMGRAISEHVWPRPGPLKDVDPINIQRLTKDLSSETPASLQAARDRMGPAGFLSDLTPELTTRAQGLSFGDNPTAKAAIREPYRIRQAKQADEMKAVLDNTVGPKMDDTAWEKSTKEYHKNAYTPLYQQWEKTVVQPTPEIKALIPRLEKAGAFKMAEELSGISGTPMNMQFFTGGSTKSYPTAETWQQVKRGLNRRIDQAYDSNDKVLAGELIQLKKELTKELHAAPGGKALKAADETFASMREILDQHAAGRDTFVGGRGGTSKDELRAEWGTLNKVEKQARIQGLRSAADEAMGATIIGDTSLRNKILAPNNQEKIIIMLGQKDGQRLIDRMQHLKYLGDQDKIVRGGSQTTSNTSAVNANKPPAPTPWDVNFAQPMTLFPPSVREGMRPTTMFDAWRKQRYGNADNQLAGLLTSEDKQLDLLLNALKSESARRKTGAAVSDQGGNLLSGMIVPSAGSTARRRLPQ